jgi:dienelactone hydrolase
LHFIFVAAAGLGTNIAETWELDLGDGWMRVLKNKWVWALLLLAAGVGGYLVWGNDQDPPPDTRLTGAWLFEDHGLASVTPLSEGRVRVRFFADGSTRQFHLIDAGLHFESSPGFDRSAPRDLDGEFMVDDGSIDRLSMRDGNGGIVNASRMALEETTVFFDSGDLELRGKLVLPRGDGPHPVVIMVHGSEAYSAVDFYFMPYMLAANGLAAFVYDKRGTGESEGEYTQHFPTLAGDARAAADWLREQPQLDDDRINLMGFSQGGWIAPLAAEQIEGMRAISVHYGVAVPITREDRWGYVYQLQQKGFGPEAIAKADSINVHIEQIIDHANSDSWPELKRLVDASRGEDWFKAVAGSDSILGTVAETRVPLWAWQVYLWFKDNGSSSRTWDPRPTLARLDIPQHWILAGEDSSAPTGETLAVLEDLRADGQPIDISLYPDAEHGILEFEQQADGSRRYSGYSESYFRTAVDWLRQANGLNETLSR